MHSKWDIVITTTKTLYKRVFIVDKVLDNTVAKFAFLLAQSADIVYIDNVSIIEGSNVSVADNKTNSLKLYPNPVVNELNVSLSSANSKVAIYNILGRKMEEVLVKGNQARIDVSSYSKGLYFVKVNNDTISKFVK